MGTPLYGKNLFPEESVLPGFRKTSLDYVAEVEKLGHRLMELVSVGLGLEAHHIHKNYTYDSLSIVRMFHYPHVAQANEKQWGIGEHSDYGLLTMLTTDSPGLQFYDARDDVWLE
eukprot:gene2798-3626_t